jgi:alpha-tubulin suppressor-like RCC1 family protein
MYVKRIIASGAGLGTLALGLAVAGGAFSTPVASGHDHAHARRQLAPAARGAAASSSPVVYQWGQYGGGHGNGLSGSKAGSPTGSGPVRRSPKVVKGIHGTVVQVASSNSDDYALTRSGAVYAWGAGTQGELGNGSAPGFSSRAVRVHFPAGVTISKLSNPMPYDGGMAIASDGHVYAWGNDQHQQFCQPHPGFLMYPVRLRMSDVTLADGALKHTIYDTHGHVVSCGTGPHGQLGNGTSGNHTQTGKPVAVEGLPQGHVVALESSWGNAGVLMGNGDYYDWGYNRSGQVGDGARTDATSAVEVGLIAPVKRIFQGGSYGNNGQTIAVLRGGSIWEWGNGRFGQMGNGTANSEDIPTEFDGLDRHRIVNVASGGLTNYAVGRSGDLWAWGDNLTGELGIGSTTRKVEFPVHVPVKVSQVSSTAHNTVALGALVTTWTLNR